MTHIIISRTDAIGDVTLTLPLCGFLKAIFPDVIISFLGRSYTQAVIECCTAVDHFVNYDDLLLLSSQHQRTYLKNIGADVIIHVFPVKHLARLAKHADIKIRIGTRNRLYHWFNCTQLVSLSRKNSSLHEAELNLMLLKPLYKGQFPPSEELYRYYHFTRIAPLSKEISEMLSDTKFNLVLHPKSRGNGKEWSLDQYAELISLLPEESYRIFISGSEKEKTLLTEWIKNLPDKDVRDITGMMPLDELIAFLHTIDGLLASGTGPLHLAAASGVYALGLFPSTRPIHPGRWAPLGEKAGYIQSSGDNLNEIKAIDVYNKICGWKKR